ncbi:MAG TPA: hypothetical protein VIJ82_01245 [Streptosporangiaceae bacterium]
MVSWQDLVAHLKSTYTITDEDEGRLVLMFNIPGGRSQLVYILGEAAANGEEWAHITSPCGRVGDVDLRSLLEKAGKSICGAAIIMADKAALRHSVHLGSLEMDQFRRPLVLIALSADLIEQELVGTDEF